MSTTSSQNYTVKAATRTDSHPRAPRETYGGREARPLLGTKVLLRSLIWARKQIFTQIVTEIDLKTQSWGRMSEGSKKLIAVMQRTKEQARVARTRRAISPPSSHSSPHQPSSIRARP